MSRLDRADFRDGHLEVREYFEQEGFELLVASINLVDQQDRRTRPVGYGFEQRALQKERLAENLRFFFGGARRRILLQLDAQQLLRIIPFVNSRRGVQALITLKSHQPGVERQAERLGDLGLADARRALNQQGFSERHRQVQRRGDCGVGHIGLPSEQLLDVSYFFSHLCLYSFLVTRWKSSTVSM